MLINKGDPKVSPESAAFYGYVTAVDQAVTFLLVNGACSLSDRFGRKPFMALANFGLGTGQIIASFAKDPRLLLVGTWWWRLSTDSIGFDRIRRSIPINRSPIHPHMYRLGH